MKNLTLIAAAVFTTLTLNSCRQSDEVLSPTEIATLKKIQDPNSALNANTELATPAPLEADGELLPPPRK
ncbi:hypothetical protein CO230_06710 [Chryseobacterium sp. 6424]|uniref:hypothetical protein n=1 Tax=Chryseobacterium sp. 6424 TaxID=2039166 RepID=UPI000EFA45C9|nr:hypothetical protein [Chryseobacterium sp. 6424]AYO57840.1 hypothetical protein CO230_06710 [Chryseobacterium sp. 6424]